MKYAMNGTSMRFTMKLVMRLGSSPKKRVAIAAAFVVICPEISTELNMGKFISIQRSNALSWTETRWLNVSPDTATVSRRSHDGINMRMRVTDTRVARRSR